MVTLCAYLVNEALPVTCVSVFVLLEHSVIDFISDCGPALCPTDAQV
jgi:hypothetical protein